jgi:hypothetical protein
LSYLLISSWELGFFNSYLKPGSISTSNERLQNRHAARLFFFRALLAQALLLVTQLSG